MTGRTHEWREPLYLDLFGDDEAAAALLAGGLSDHRDGVLGAGAQTVEGGGARDGAVGVVEAEGEPVLGMPERAVRWGWRPGTHLG